MLKLYKLLSLVFFNYIYGPIALRSLALLAPLYHYAKPRHPREEEEDDDYYSPDYDSEDLGWRDRPKRKSLRKSQEEDESSEEEEEDEFYEDDEWPQITEELIKKLAPKKTVPESKPLPPELAAGLSS